MSGASGPAAATPARYPAQRPIDGARIPTLEAVLRAEPGLHVTIEMKLLADRPEATVSPEAMAAFVAAVVERAGALERVGVSCFDWRGMRAMRLLCPAMARGWLTEPRTAAAAALWWDLPSRSRENWPHGSGDRRRGRAARGFRRTARLPATRLRRRSVSGCAWCRGRSTTRARWPG